MWVALRNAKKKQNEEMGVSKNAEGQLVPLVWEYRFSNDNTFFCYKEVAAAPGFPQFRCEFWVDAEDASLKQGRYED